jgi:hypothetical protein
MAKVKLDLKTADGKHLKDLEFSTPLFEVLKAPDGKYYVGEVIVLNLEYRKNPKKDIKKIFHDKSKAEQEVFKINKLNYFPKIENYKENFKKSLKILSNFTDKELYDFVQLNKDKIS